MKYFLAVMTLLLLALTPKSYAQSLGNAVVVVDSKTGQVAIGVGSDEAIDEFQRSGAEPPAAPAVTPIEGRIEFGKDTVVVQPDGVVTDEKVAASPEQKLDLIRKVVGANSSLFWSYFPSITVAGGVQLGDWLEVGAEAGIVIAVFTIGVHADVYAKLSPIPVGFGKRIYVGALVGKAKLIDPTESGSSIVDPYTDYFVGYRNLTKESLGRDQGYWFTEVGTRTMGPAGDRQRSLALKVGFVGLFGGQSR